jgi:hypothetical protein
MPADLAQRNPVTFFIFLLWWNLIDFNLPEFITGTYGIRVPEKNMRNIL